ncbi:MAG: ABC transporter permease [Polyangiaceae bacterium]|nr:ABC transporter permease [Polyangiaceae bacterium]
MSAQTGRPTLADAPPSSRRIDRARIRVENLKNDPNPIWMREMRQAARLGRTPIILAVITGLMALLICAVGGVASVKAEPAKVGVALFHTFFSLAFAVVTWIGPAVAASTIASERSGRTWEALSLTGLGPTTIAQGKFLASLTYISLYIVMLVPVGALPFLFGGVSATEVLAAFALLFCFGVLSVAFGLSISSQFSSSAVAIVVTLLVAIPLSLMVYLLGGVALSVAVHDLWPAIPKGAPVWLPTAYVRAELGLEYLAFLVLAPLVVIGVPAWFLYEVTVANMGGVSDDRSSGIRRWFLVSAPAFCVAAVVPTFAVPSDRWAATAIALSLMFIFLTTMAFVFAGEPLGPSRRVLIHWERRGVGRLRRYLGPGITRAVSLLMILGTLCLGLQMAVGVILELTAGGPLAHQNATRVVAFGGYLVGYCLFLAGLSAWTRARAATTSVPRAILVAALFLTSAGPWLAMAVAGVLTEGSDGAFVFASPSPTYVFVMMKQIGSTSPDAELILAAGGASAFGWGLLGLGLFGAAATRARKVVRAHQKAQHELDALLAAEDEAAARGPEPAPEPAPAPQPEPAPPLEGA